MLHVVTHGKPDTAMPGFHTQLSPEDVATVVDYVRAAFMVPAPMSEQIASKVMEVVSASASIVDMNASMPDNLQGDPMMGQGLYAGNCSTCHGMNGDGQGPRAYFILPKPRNFQHAGSRSTYNRPALYRAIARGTLGSEMPAWDTVLNPQQIADLAEYVFRTFIRPETAALEP